MACNFVLYEAALRGPHVDKEQLLDLLEVGQMPNVSIQVLPFERAVPAALLGPMVLLETRDHERFVFDEGQFASNLSFDPAVVSSQAERLSMIRAVALSPAESVRSIERMAEEL